MPIGNQREKHYSMLIQGLLTNGTFEWTKPYKYRNPTITSITVLFRPSQVMLNNVNSINVLTNTNDEKRRIPIGYYSIGEIIAILNTMTDTPFSISTKVSSNECIWIQSPHTIDFSIAPDIRGILDLEGYTIILPASFYGKNVIDITQNRQLKRCINR